MSPPCCTPAAHSSGKAAVVLACEAQVWVHGYKGFAQVLGCLQVLCHTCQEGGPCTDCTVLALGCVINDDELVYVEDCCCTRNLWVFDERPVRASAASPGFAFM